MNAVDVLKYGHQTVLQTLDGVPVSAWETGGVCGVWSVKEIIAHLASYEHLLIDVLNGLLDGGPTPCLDAYLEVGAAAFNDLEVEKRKGKTVDETLEEYNAAQAQTMALIAQAPVEARRQPGTLPWYGSEYALEDFIVYQYYGHKREHCAQIDVYRDRLAG
ncbi:MAG: hypothetical protein Kow00120_24260 [Anaerolineae bacterium]